MKCKHKKTEKKDFRSADGNYIYEHEICTECGETVNVGERRHVVFSAKGF